MVKRFENFAKFGKEMHVEFSLTGNERLKTLVNLIVTLHQGCGCSKRARAEKALREYLIIGTFLTEDNMGLLRGKYPNHTIEFAQDGGVFFVIQPQ